jgi:hypothetical protein
LLGVTHRVGLQRAEGNDQNLGPLGLHLLEKIATFTRAKIDKEQGGPRLLQYGIEPAGIGDVPHLRQCAQKCFQAPRQIGVLRI